MYAIKIWGGGGGGSPNNPKIRNSLVLLIRVGMYIRFKWVGIENIRILYSYFMPVCSSHDYNSEVPWTLHEAEVPFDEILSSVP